MTIDKLFLRGHHLSNLAVYCLDEYSFAELIYGDGRIDLYREFRDNPTLPVEIVEGLDSICEAAGAEECLDFDPCCVFKDPVWDEDEATLREYDLKVGETYCASDIIERFIDYKTTTGLTSPRDKFLVRIVRGR
ncbi:DUF1284 domain-containing protein [Candidatus Pacearchaeota archaeon]|nr:DUF1284 domain-containing protein [Candidatus Pacearchaeota archaeon]